MRKQTKLAVGISAAALLAIGASMTTFAAGWVQEGDTWYYNDSYGDHVTNKWKSSNGNYFYLGDDGAMERDKLIEDGNDYYYVDANGVMVKNAWYKIAADENEDQDVEYRWYYFGSTGKAYRNSTNKTIKGKKYGFDDNGKMLFGFVQSDSKTIVNDQDDPVLQSDMYFGTADDGARTSGWLEYTDGFSTRDDLTKDVYWFYYNTNGKKAVSTSKTIKGKKYAFDSDGLMRSSFSNAATIGATTTWGYYSAADDGHLAKNTWIWAVPESGIDAVDKDEDNKRWFRADSAGKLVRGKTKKINNRWYVFSNDGIMLWGIIDMPFDTATACANLVDGIPFDHHNTTHDPADLTKADVMAMANPMYFSNDEEKDGSLKTGSSIKVELSDGDVTMGFEKSGKAYNGVKNNKLWVKGILQKASSDSRYEAKPAADGVGFVIVNTSGTLMNKGQYKTADDLWYGVGSTNKKSDGVLYATKDAAKAANP